MPSVSRLRRSQAMEIARLPAWPEIIRGTLRPYQIPCGRQNCRCRRSKRHHHGPYWYVSISHEGKTKMVLIPVSQRMRVKRGIAAYHKLWKQLCRISEINLMLVKGGFE